MIQPMRIALALLLVPAAVMGRSPGDRPRDLRDSLRQLAARAEVRLVLDRAVQGPPVSTSKDHEPPLESLRRAAEGAGYTVTVARPPADETVVMVGPGAAAVLVEPTGARFLIDAMVVGVSPDILADLRATGTERPAGDARSMRPRYLDGLGPGFHALAYPADDAHLDRLVPWGTAGLVSPHHGEVRSRDRFSASPGEPVQVPLVRRLLHAGEGPHGTHGVLKEALVVIPRRGADGRIHLELALEKSVQLSDEVDPSPARGGKARTTLSLDPGAEALVWGLGVEPASPAVSDHDHDPLRNRRLRRLGDRDHHRDRGHRDGHHIPLETVVKIRVTPIR